MFSGTFSKWILLTLCVECFVRNHVNVLFTSPQVLIEIYQLFRASWIFIPANCSWIFLDIPGLSVDFSPRLPQVHPRIILRYPDSQDLYVVESELSLDNPSVENDIIQVVQSPDILLIDSPDFKGPRFIQGVRSLKFFMRSGIQNFPLSVWISENQDIEEIQTCTLTIASGILTLWISKIPAYPRSLDSQTFWISRGCPESLAFWSIPL